MQAVLISIVNSQTHWLPKYPLICDFERYLRGVHTKSWRTFHWRKYDPGCSSWIRITNPDFLPIPDHESRGQKGTGSRIRTNENLLVFDIMVVVRAVCPDPRRVWNVLLDTDSRLILHARMRWTKDQDLLRLSSSLFSRLGSRKKITYTDTGYRGSKTQ